MERGWKGPRPRSEHSSARRCEGAKDCPEEDGKEHPRPGGNEGVDDLAGAGNISRFQEPVPLLCGSDESLRVWLSFK